ncbi:MAG: hypothetical protein ACR2QC_01270 [Gammaproteobacteria bacterium]
MHPRPIPAKAGISTAAKRREIVRLLQFAPSARIFLPSQEWDGGLKRKIQVNKEIPAFAGMAVFYIFGYRQIRYCPQRQKAPPFRRKPESRSCVAGIPPKTAAPPTN